MDTKEARSYLKSVRDYRKEIGKPLHDPTTLPDQKASILEGLRTLRDLNREDPYYRQSLRIISELKSQSNIIKPADVIEQKTEFPTDPEERFKAIISSIGNHAGKQITFLSISSTPGYVTTPGETHRNFLENSGNVWHINNEVPKKHALQSLVPLGMVAEEIGFRNGESKDVVGFTQTKAGEVYGDPIAKFLLKYAAEHNNSMETILGRTGPNSDSRAPYNRAQILVWLLERDTRKPATIADIRKALPLEASLVGQALDSLEHTGFIETNNIKAGIGQDQYVYIPHTQITGELTSRYKDSLWPVVTAINNLFSPNVPLGIDVIFAEVQKTHPDFKRSTTKHVLADLARNNYLTRGDFKGGHTDRNLSSITLLKPGEEFIRDVLVPLKVALTDTPEGEAIRAEWRKIDWRTYAPHALEVHKENSVIANIHNPIIVQNAILQIVSEHPGITTSEVSVKLKKLGMPSAGTARFLNPLVGSGRLRKDMNEGIAKWHVVEESVGLENLE